MKKLFKMLLVSLTVFLIAACSNDPKEMTFEEYIKTTDFNEFEYNSEYDVYIVSQDLSTILSDENGIENFNDSIYDVLSSEVTTDKDIVFRGWDGSLPGALIYFKASTFNDISNSGNVYNSTEIYKKSNGWQITSKFGQYLISNDYSDTTTIEETLFELAMYSK